MPIGPECVVGAALFVAVSYLLGFWIWLVFIQPWRKDHHE
jgi:hypothetical protein